MSKKTETPVVEDDQDVVVSTSRAVMSIEDRLRQDADTAREKLKLSSDRIRTKGNLGFLIGSELVKDEIQVYILDWLHSNQFYEGPYNANDPKPPTCWAIGEHPDALAPSDKVPSPQASTCALCPQNKFGSGANGKGKACKNTIPIAVVLADEAEENPAKATIYTINVAPKGLKNFQRYVNNLRTEHSTHPLGVVTKITLDKNQTFAVLNFDAPRKANMDVATVLYDRKPAAIEILSVEPTPDNEK